MTATTPTAPTADSSPRRGWRVPTWAGVTTGAVLVGLALLGIAAAIRRHRFAMHDLGRARIERFGAQDGHVHWLFWIVVVLLAVAGIALLVAALRAPRTRAGASARNDGTVAPSPAEQILAERYARGEIDDEEFRARRAALRS